MADRIISTEEEPEGFRIPVHKSLTSKHMLGGVPMRLAIFNWTFCVALTMPLRTWYAIPISLFIHAVAYALAQRDPQFYDVIKRSIWLKTFYRG